MKFLQTLKERNSLLYWFGSLMLTAAVICVMFTQLDNTIVLGINAWIKPMKFYVSIWIFCWTMACFLPYLKQPVKERSYSIMVIVAMSIEMVIITWQAANGRLSHFNESSPLYGILFTIMGISITILGVWTGYIGYLFFKLKPLELEESYLWGIRLGILFFVIFSFEGGLMASRLAHTVGAADGGEGYALVNWSKKHGDLRIAHFLGMHALQLLPIAGYFLFKKSLWTILFGIMYATIVTVIFVIALRGLPIIPV
ncbi:MAG: hypothetical protein JWQ40_1514 [Segetibacter sp.]|nr:hypothetical protein [Segetibacter sp.]